MKHDGRYLKFEKGRGQYTLGADMGSSITTARIAKEYEGTIVHIQGIWRRQEVTRAEDTTLTVKPVGFFRNCLLCVKDLWRQKPDVTFTTNA